MANEKTEKPFSLIGKAAESWKKMTTWLGKRKEAIGFGALAGLLTTGIFLQPAWALMIPHILTNLPILGPILTKFSGAPAAVSSFVNGLDWSAPTNIAQNILNTVASPTGSRMNLPIVFK